MMSGKSSSSQATLFQTWGYNSNHPATTRAQRLLHKPNSLLDKKNKFKNSSKILEKPNVDLWSGLPEQNLQNQCNEVHITNGARSCDEIMNILNDDNDDDMELMEISDKTEQHTYLDSKSSTTSSPENLSGFDETAGHNYIYPVNYPVRDYQFNIIMKALVKNTLVVLPTGLGKTFIAAVVMYNFYRWYPKGKILFMAPTKPLVAQQIQACYSITGTPVEDTAEMTGSMPPSKRKLMWRKNRLFFLTPHVLQNDLERGACSASDIVCLVFDEAHKALGNYSYCQVIKEVSGIKSNFRVLALSATPGDDMKAVQSVVDNLLISHVELRSEESEDIKPYVFGRNIEKIVVPLSEELKKAKAMFLEVVSGVIKRLNIQGVFWQSDPSRVSKFFILKAREDFRARGMDDKTRAGMIEGDFALAISLYHAYELLQQHGLLSFYNFLKEICSGKKGTARGRNELMRHERFMEMMNGLQQDIENPENLDATLEGPSMSTLTPKRRLLKSIPQPNSLFSSHPKLIKLEEVVVKHFENAKENIAGPLGKTPLSTRVMIFSQYRDSVQEITAVLNKHQPLVKVMSFVGQNGATKGKKGLTQKEQLEVVDKFRTGGFNVLVSTSVGEEGLDIGDVDLIICFDASNSPIRLVQRMGRTGRKRSGRIVVLVTEGKEEQIYKRSLSNKKSIHKKLLDATKSLVLYDASPRMIPKHLNPYCLKMQITVNAKGCDRRGTKRKSMQRSLETSMKGRTGKNAAGSKNISRSGSDGFLTAEEEEYWKDNFVISDPITEGINLETAKLVYPSVALNEWLQWQSIAQPIKFATHSAKTYKFCELIEQIETLNAEMEDENSYCRELEIYMVDNQFIEENCSKKKINSHHNTKMDSLSIPEKKPPEVSCKEQKRKSKESSLANTAKSWRQSNFKEMSIDEHDDDFDVTKRRAKVSETSPREAVEEVKIEDVEKNGRYLSERAAELRKCSTKSGIDKTGNNFIADNKMNKKLEDVEELCNNDDFRANKTSPDGACKIKDENSLGTNLPSCSRGPEESDIHFHDKHSLPEHVSNLFPISEPVRNYIKARSKGPELESQTSCYLDPVPSPPKISDLSFLCSDDLQETGSNNVEGRSGALEIEMGKRDQIADSTSMDCYDKSKKTDEDITGFSSVNQENVMIHPELKLEEKNDTRGHFCIEKKQQYSNLHPLFASEDSSSPRKMYENHEQLNTDNETMKEQLIHPRADLKADDLSAIDFGESLLGMDDYEDFDDCPSPPVVSAFTTAATDTDKVSTDNHNEDAAVNYSKDDKTTLPACQINEPSDLCLQLGKACKEDDNKFTKVAEIDENTLKCQGQQCKGQESSSLIENKSHVEFALGNDDSMIGNFDLFEDEENREEQKDHQSIYDHNANDIETEIYIDSEEEPQSEPPVLSLASRLRRRNIYGVDLISNRKNHEIITNDCIANVPTTNMSKRDLPKHSERRGHSCYTPCELKRSIAANEEVMHHSQDDPLIEFDMVAKPVVQKCTTNNQLDNVKRRKTSALDCEVSAFVNDKNISSNHGHANTTSDDDSPLKFCRRRPKTRKIDDSTLFITDDDQKMNMDESMIDCCTTKKLQVGREAFKINSQSSDDDFQHHVSFTKPKESNIISSRQRNPKAQNVKKKKKSKQWRSDFVEYEAEVTDSNSEDEEEDFHRNEYVMDSFIDDGTQLTQSTPAKNRKDPSAHVDMNMIYRQSLFSPMYGALNFRTPIFKANRNRYKMIDRGAWQHPRSDEDDEAEEVNEVESDKDFEQENSIGKGRASDENSLESLDYSHGNAMNGSAEIMNVSSTRRKTKKPRIRRIIDSEDDDEDVHGRHDESPGAQILNISENSISRKTVAPSKSKEPGKIVGEHVLNAIGSGLPVNAEISRANELPKENTDMDNMNSFLPTFDLGLEIGEIDSETVQRIWKEVWPCPESDEASKDSKHLTSDNVLKQTQKEAIQIIAQSKTITSCQVGSFLRLKHQIELTVCSELGCDFAISKRMGVLRRNFSDVSNGANSSKNRQAIREMCDQYAKRCVIIEKDRVKGSSINERAVSYTKYFSGLLGHLASCGIKILFSDSQEESAMLISMLAKKENELSYGLSDTCTKLMKDNLKQMLKVLLTFPCLTYPVAIEICNKFKSFSVLIRSRPEELKARIPQLSMRKAKEISQYMRHQVFAPQL